MILLVDDNAVQAATRQIILKRAGYYVVVALSPERALEQFRNQEYPAPVDLVITDHLMPGMTGADFTTGLRAFAPGVAVLVISGLEEAEQEYVGLNVQFLLKPVLPEHLLATVRRLINSGSPVHGGE